MRNPYRRNRSQSGHPLVMMMVVILVGVVSGVLVTIRQTTVSPLTATLQITPATPSVISINTPILPTLRPELPRYSLYIPSLGKTGQITHLPLEGSSWDVQSLGNNVGHLIGTAWFDDAEAGNVVLAGHVELRDGKQGIFAGLNTLPIGDTFTIYNGEVSRHYVIESSYETDPSDLTPLYWSSDAIVTLITCSDYDLLGNEYLSRYIVVARMIDL